MKLHVSFLRRREYSCSQILSRSSGIPSRSHTVLILGSDDPLIFWSANRSPGHLGQLAERKIAQHERGNAALQCLVLSTIGASFSSLSTCKKEASLVSHYVKTQGHLIGPGIEVLGVRSQCQARRQIHRRMNPALFVGFSNDLELHPGTSAKAVAKLAKRMVGVLVNLEGSDQSIRLHGIRHCDHKDLSGSIRKCSILHISVDLFCGGGFGARGAVRGGGVPLLGLAAWKPAR